MSYAEAFSSDISINQLTAQTVLAENLQFTTSTISNLTVQDSTILNQSVSIIKPPNTDGSLSTNISLTMIDPDTDTPSYSLPLSNGSAGQFLSMPSSGTELVWTSGSGGSTAIQSGTNINVTSVGSNTYNVAVVASPSFTSTTTGTIIINNALFPNPQLTDAGKVLTANNVQGMTWTTPSASGIQSISNTDNNITVDSTIPSAPVINLNASGIVVTAITIDNSPFLLANAGTANQVIGTSGTDYQWQDQGVQTITTNESNNLNIDSTVPSEPIITLANNITLGSGVVTDDNSLVTQSLTCDDFNQFDNVNYVNWPTTNETVNIASAGNVLSITSIDAQTHQATLGWTAVATGGIDSISNEDNNLSIISTDPANPIINLATTISVANITASSQLTVGESTMPLATTATAGQILSSDATNYKWINAPATGVTALASADANIDVSSSTGSVTLTLGSDLLIGSATPLVDPQSGSIEVGTAFANQLAIADGTSVVNFPTASTFANSTVGNVVSIQSISLDKKTVNLQLVPQSGGGGSINSIVNTDGNLDITGTTTTTINIAEPFNIGNFDDPESGTANIATANINNLVINDNTNQYTLPSASSTYQGNNIGYVLSIGSKNQVTQSPYITNLTWVEVPTGFVSTVEGGANITVDSSDQSNPIVNLNNNIILNGTATNASISLGTEFVEFSEPSIQVTQLGLTDSVVNAGSIISPRMQCTSLEVNDLIQNYVFPLASNTVLSGNLNKFLAITDVNILQPNFPNTCTLGWVDQSATTGVNSVTAGSSNIVIGGDSTDVTVDLSGQINLVSQTTTDPSFQCGDLGYFAGNPSNPPNPGTVSCPTITSTQFVCNDTFNSYNIPSALAMNDDTKIGQVLTLTNVVNNGTSSVATVALSPVAQTASGVVDFIGTYVNGVNLGVVMSPNVTLSKIGNLVAVTIYTSQVDIDCSVNTSNFDISYIINSSSNAFSNLCSACGINFPAYPVCLGSFQAVNTSNEAFLWKVFVQGSPNIIYMQVYSGINANDNVVSPGTGIYKVQTTTLYPSNGTTPTQITNQYDLTFMIQP